MTGLLRHALAYAAGEAVAEAGPVAVFPCAPRSKAPAVAGGRGVLDASTDPAQIREWWSEYPGANIGGRVPEHALVLDVDPRNRGDVELRRLITEHGGAWTRTLAARTGGGGWHLFFEHPGGAVSQSGLPGGLDLKTSAGYVVLDPSRHPNGRAYRWCAERRPIVPAVDWLVDLLRPMTVAPAPRPPRREAPVPAGVTPAEHFEATHDWADVLTGWTRRKGDGESDGSVWVHPHSSHPLTAKSAVVRYGCLFVFTTSTSLPVTATGDRHGLTKFRAWALLQHGGDLSAAARAVRSSMGRAA